MFEVEISQFSGPLDLMLFLIKDKKLDLFDLDIRELTDQYIAYIHAMEELKLEIASEYLSELAGLIEYKSKKLLPRDESLLDAEKPDDGPTLVQRLIEYQKYKEITADLNQRYQERLDQFAKAYSKDAVESVRDEVNAASFITGDVYDLVKAMNKVYARFKMVHPFETTIMNEELSVDDRIEQLRHYLDRHTDVFSLVDLLHQSNSLQHVIVTFLAVLDMIRMHEMYVSFDDDAVYLKGSALNG